MWTPAMGHLLHQPRRHDPFFDGGPALIEQWMRSKDTLLFLGTSERLNNAGFKPHEFEGLKNEAGRNSFCMSPKKWGKERAQ